MAAEAAEAADSKVDDIEVQDYKMKQDFELNSEK